MNQTEIYNFFEQQISKMAIQNIDGEWQVVGKWCRVSFDDDGKIDVWICNSADIPTGLTKRKVKNVICGFKSVVGATFTELTGEAYTKVAAKEDIVQNLNLLGIRKKRHISESQLKQMANQLEKARRAA